ncbi:hypothetical protein BOX15_Mlig016364g2, partial [Macrostomum lignano]
RQTMDKEIKRISSESTHQICSAQVITSCESVIKELIENSLDSGATNIEIRLQNYGLDLIEVIDNGGGIAYSDFDGITLKHHTSKLRQFDGLLSVKTFGFRGEALSSLCAVSELSIHTYSTSDSTGTVLSYDHAGCVQSQLAKPRQPGTTVSARNLFRQFPVRLKEMQKTGQRELKACARCVTAYALAHTGIKFCLSHQPSQSGKRTVALKTSGCSSLDDCIAALFTTSQAKSLLPLCSPDSWLQILPEDQRPRSITDSQERILQEMDLSGRISSPLPGMGRPAGDRQFFYINNRPCQLPRLARLVNEVYKLYNRTQHPFVIMHLRLPTDAIDVNLTPDKRSIYLCHEHLLTACLKAQLQQRLDLANGCLSMPVRGLGPGLTDYPAAPVLASSQQASVSVDADPPDSSSGANSPTPICRSQSPVLSSTLSVADEAAADTDAVTGKSALEKLRSAFACSKSRSTGAATEYAPVAKSPSTKSYSARSPPRKRQKSLAAFWSPASKRPVAGDEDGDESTETFEAANNFSKSSKLDIPQMVTVEKPDSNDEADDEAAIQPEEDFVYDDCPEFGGCNDPALTAAARPRIVCPFRPDRLLQLYETDADCRTDDSLHARFRARIRPEESAAAEAELRASLDRDGLRRLRPIGQFNLGFLPSLLDSSGDLFLVDQHAADEKCRFEALQRSDGCHLTRQPLAAPKQLRLTFAQEETVASALPRFSAARFDMEFDSEAPVGSRLKLLSVPLGLGKWSFGLSDLEELIELVSADGDGSGEVSAEATLPPLPLLLPSRVRAMLASRACRSAVMIGDALDARQRARILASLAELDQPWNCPHGRPTIRHLLHVPDALKSVPLYPE